MNGFPLAALLVLLPIAVMACTWFAAALDPKLCVKRDKRYREEWRQWWVAFHAQYPDISTERCIRDKKEYNTPEIGRQVNEGQSFKRLFFTLAVALLAALIPAYWQAFHVWTKDATRPQFTALCWCLGITVAVLFVWMCLFLSETVLPKEARTTQLYVCTVPNIKDEPWYISDKAAREAKAARGPKHARTP